jgi:predicted nucleic acid-binding protein
MRFWDTSAIVPLLMEQRASRACRSLRRADPAVAVWLLTRVEVTSAVFRLVREGLLPRADGHAVLRRAHAMFERFTEVVALDAARERAERILALHPLSAADALQLAAALTLVSDRPRRRGFVTCDDRLAAAASDEGFEAIVPA